MMTHRSIRLFAGLLGAVAASLISAGTAGANHSPCHVTPIDPSVDQYVEQVPSSCGQQQAGKKSRTVGKLPRQVRNALQSQAADESEAALLEQVVTSTKYGAPEKKLRLGREQRRELRTLRNDPPRPIPSAIGTVVNAEDRGLLALAIALAVMTAAAVGAAVLRTRTARSDRR